jgi:hypothetical protein
MTGGQMGIKTIDEIPKNIFCPMPFLALDISAPGNASYCCESQVQLPRSVPIQPQSFFESPVFQKDRELMRMGAIPLGCAGCFKSEQKGLQSKRQMEIARFESGFYGWSSKDLCQSSELLFFSYRIGNQCNLSCFMCSSESSHIIALEDWFNKKGNSPGPEPTPVLNVIDFDTRFDYLKWLYVGGGEPLISPHFKMLLEYLIKHNRLDIVISFNTNLSVMPEDILSLLSSFRAVKFNVSLDGFEDSLEYIRYPLKWKTFEKNLKKLEALTHFKVGLHFTVSALNLSSLPSLLSFLVESWKGQAVIDFRAPILTTPAEQDLAILKKDALLKHKHLIESCLENLSSAQNIELTSALSNLIRYIELCISEEGLSVIEKIQLARDLRMSLDRKDKIRQTCSRAIFKHLDLELEEG